MTAPSGAPTTAAEQLHPVVVHHIVNTLGWPSLRPLQEAAVGPLVRGEDALLLAPTAGGKTEAAAFPVLSRMEFRQWRDLSVLYVCPLRALLNNLEPRLAGYASWLGRRVGLWHGDTSDSARRAMVSDQPDILLTTPESLESILCSTRTTPHRMFSALQAVVVDEVHAFAGDDRGWHLLAVLERLSRVAGRPFQRVGLSATVGNPEELLHWLQGPNPDRRPGRVIAPTADAPTDPDLHLDFVGSLENAATVIAALHTGEKRLAFVDSRRGVETLASELRAREVETFASHSSLSSAERKRSEAAFAEARNCVIVATSTLELGIDIGDLDRVLQIGAPRTVASFLQRLGRSGRRAGTTRNTLFLARDDDEVLQAAGLLLLWSEGYVEPIVPPAKPRHLMAQQLLALCRQESRVGAATWPEWLGGLQLADPAERDQIVEWLLDNEFLDVDGGMMFIGPEAEERYGFRYFMELLSVFTSEPVFLVLHGRQEIGTIEPLALTRRAAGPRVLALAGRPWDVTHIDWKRRIAHVEPSTARGRTLWKGLAQPLSFALTDAIRRVILGTTPERVALSQRATAAMARLREEFQRTVDRDASVITNDDGTARWWTWAGGRANACLCDALSAVDPTLTQAPDRIDNRYLPLRSGAAPGEVRDALTEARRRFGADFAGVIPNVSPEAVERLKFNDMLPPSLAIDTVGNRDLDRAGAVVAAARRLQGS